MPIRQRLTQMKAWLATYGVYLRQRVPDWSSLYHISTSKIVRSSYFWFVFVPIVARMLDQIPTVLKIPWHGEPLALSIALPFSWQLFFFSATFIALANLIYTMRCPELIKTYRTFSDFEKEGKGPYQLLKFYSMSVLHKLKSTPERQVRESVREFYTSYCVPDTTLHDKIEKAVPLVKILSDLDLKTDSLRGAFWHARDFMERVRPLARFLCTFLYASGFILISFVALQNFTGVLKRSSLCPHTISFCVDSILSNKKSITE